MAQSKAGKNLALMVLLQGFLFAPIAHAQCWQGEQEKRLAPRYLAPLAQDQQSQPAADLILTDPRFTALVLKTKSLGLYKGLRQFTRQSLMNQSPIEKNAYRLRRLADVRRLLKIGTMQALRKALDQYPIPSLRPTVARPLINQLIEQGEIHDALIRGHENLNPSQETAFLKLGELKAFPLFKKTRDLHFLKREQKSGSTSQKSTALQRPLKGPTVLFQTQSKDRSQTLIISRTQTIDPDFEGIEFSGFEVPKRRHYWIQSLDRNKVLSWRRSLGQCQGRFHDLTSTHALSSERLYALLENQVLLSIDRRSGELFWINARQNNKVPQITIPEIGPAPKFPDQLRVTRDRVLLISKNRTELLSFSPLTGVELSQKSLFTRAKFVTVILNRFLLFDSQNTAHFGFEKMAEHKGLSAFQGSHDQPHYFKMGSHIAAISSSKIVLWDFQTGLQSCAVRPRKHSSIPRSFSLGANGLTLHFSAARELYSLAKGPDQ
jgi:hypothetical protein